MAKKALAEKLDKGEKLLNDNPNRRAVGNVKPFKKWSNNPELQNQETGKTTEKGAARKAAVAKKTGVDQGGDEAPAKGKKVTSSGKAAAAKSEKRAARASINADRKIKVLNKENPYREGSNRAASFAAVLKAKTVGQYIDAGGAAKYLSRWENEGRIELG